MGLHVEIDRDVCMGSGSCVFLAPDAFALDDDGIAVVVDPDAAHEESVRNAAARCPSKAITVTPSP